MQQKWPGCDNFTVFSDLYNQNRLGIISQQTKFGNLKHFKMQECEVIIALTMGGGGSC